MLCGFVAVLPSVLVAHHQNSRPSASPTAVAILDWFAGNLADRPKSAFDLFGVSDAELATIRRTVDRVVISPSLEIGPNETTYYLGRRLEAASVKIIGTLASKPNANLADYMRGVMVVDWVRTHIMFDPHLVDKGYYSPEDRRNRFTPDYILQMPPPATGCGGLTWMSALLARRMGAVDLVKVEGRLRGFGEEGPPDHSWIVLNLPSGDKMLAEPTHTRMSLARARQLDGLLDHPLRFSLDSRSVGLFVADRYAMTANTPVFDAQGMEQKPKTIKFSQDPYVKIPFAQWLGLPTRELDPIRRSTPDYSREATIG